VADSPVPLIGGVGKRVDKFSAPYHPKILAVRLWLRQTAVGFPLKLHRNLPEVGGTGKH